MAPGQALDRRSLSLSIFTCSALFCFRFVSLWQSVQTSWGEGGKSPGARHIAITAHFCFQTGKKSARSDETPHTSKCRAARPAKVLLSRREKQSTQRLSCETWVRFVRSVARRRRTSYGCLRQWVDTSRRLSICAGSTLNERCSLPLVRWCVLFGKVRSETEDQRHRSPGTRETDWCRPKRRDPADCQDSRVACGGRRRWVECRRGIDTARTHNSWAFLCSFSLSLSPRLSRSSLRVCVCYKQAPGVRQQQQPEVNEQTTLPALVDPP